MSCFRRNVSLGTRLVLAADFAHRVRDLLHKGTAANSRVRAAPSPSARCAPRSTRPRRRRCWLRWTATWTALDAPGDATASLIASWLVERKRLPHSPRFAALLDGIFASIRVGARRRRGRGARGPGAGRDLARLRAPPGRAAKARRCAQRSDLRQLLPALPAARAVHRRADAARAPDQARRAPGGGALPDRDPSRDRGASGGAAGPDRGRAHARAGRGARDPDLHQGRSATTSSSPRRCCVPRARRRASRSGGW